VRHKNEVAISNVLKVVERSRQGVDVALTRVPRFLFCWGHDHLRHDPAMYRCDYDRLID
jgi:hypothetical protein